MGQEEGKIEKVEVGGSEVGLGRCGDKSEWVKEDVQITLPKHRCLNIIIIFGRR